MQSLATPPENTLVKALLTDYYQITMAYAYWRSKKHNSRASFDLFFRKSPFQGEFTIFCGLEDSLRFLAHFGFSDEDIQYLKTVMGDTTDPGFFEYLRHVDASDVTVHAIPEGSVVFPKVPLIRVEGPLAVVQLIETTLLTLVNFASLVATNAARFRLAAGPKARMLEFGLRRAQGPDGGLTASKYCYIGGFDATSNVMAGKLHDIPIAGTHAHSFVSSFRGMEEIPDRSLAYADKSDTCKDFGQLVKEKLSQLQSAWIDSPAAVHLETNLDELGAFTAYAIAFPSKFLALVDTYDTLRSGVPNFIAVALALCDLGYAPHGIRLDSGDLAYQSIESRKYISWTAERFKCEKLNSALIVASNDINEDTLNSLAQHGHRIDSFGVGTHLVTCQAQPALGAVYKIVELDGNPCMKLSADVEKVTIPGKKDGYRLHGRDGAPICDVLLREGEKAPVVGEAFLCRHPFQEQKRAHVRPQKVTPLYKTYWDKGEAACELPTIHELKQRVTEQVAELRQDHKRRLNPTPYKVSVSSDLYTYIHELWLQHAPIGELS
ncbi:nicotinate phosphoribosyltransferase domain containing 1 [Salpingoeca rosetta]|uniref:Nicotinate phosphoribosyltransferase n=1 Tax=Salpingoeca rosetta (strain ATCC 50818 / BSB-021) TaxID=946362 RepID=F2UPB4_SALR5|nr:nicotinate phosphoribosyltransferase domain containing 1 [Salpingoeca rosetta]EGD79469.1 nicotinate phosphoribosyltransferase domain containing 1 [Salpingoeca rosetta]|eukprot:XP_004988950.1 nicotinate phosphoribosyltransferase domain containing 1 [Salpingoeca rosetta]